MTGNCDTVINTCRGFGYDEFDRLQSQTVGQGAAQNFTYVYDRYGNRWQQNVTAGSGPQFQIGFDKGNNRDCDGCYDAAGNKTYDGIHNYTYDAEGNVTAVDGGQTATYTYDALNRRFRVKNAQNTVVWQENADFGIRDTYYWGSQPFAYHGFSGGTYYEQQDWLGTERLRTDSSGKTVATYFSLPFGDGFSSTGGSDETPDHFAGTERDAETATDHAQFRQYQEGLGRWMSGDPYLGSYNFGNPQSLNRYSYMLDNPLSGIDPLGLDDPEGCDSEGSDCGVGGGDGGGGGGGDGSGVSGGGVTPGCESGCVDQNGNTYAPDGNGGISGGSGGGVTVDGGGDDGGGFGLGYSFGFGGFGYSGINFGSFSGGGGGGRGPSKNPCANSTLTAVGTTAQQQIATAQGFIAAGQVGASATPYANPVLSFFGGMYGYYEAVHTGGPSDIKNQPGPGHHNQVGVDAGNISFGITCPYGGGFCQFAAGLAQALSGTPNFNGTLATGFDTPSDNAGIRVGQAMRAAGCHE